MFFTDNRMLYLILAIFILMSLMQMSQPSLLGLLLTLPAVLVAITFHEYAHAFAATKLGDDTPQRQGRLSLNPLAHIDPVGFALLLFVGFGWGKPVQIDSRNFDRKYSEQTGDAIVAVAGPVMNFILAIVSTIIYALIYKFVPAFIMTESGYIVKLILQYMIAINLGLGVFNLIPLPPLDGSKILVCFLPYNAKRFFYEKQQIFYIIFLILWITGLAGYIISPVLNFLSNGLMKFVFIIFGI